MRLESQTLKRLLIVVLFLLPATLMWLSCVGSSSSSASKNSGLAYRAFISNYVTSGSSSFAGVYILNALNDTRGPLAPISAGNTPGIMVVTPNMAQTLVFSGNGTQFSDNQFTIVNNATESPTAHVGLPGMTYSFVVSPGQLHRLRRRAHGRGDRATITRSHWSH